MYLIEAQIPDNKSVVFALKHVYGIGYFHAIQICKQLGFSENFKVKNLSKNQVNRLLHLIESLNIEIASDLKKLKLLQRKKLINIKSYKGLRLNQGLPVRGQRTHTNSKTARNIRL